MSQKHRLKEIHDKLRELIYSNEVPPSEQLHNTLNELHAEITAMADTGDGEGGNSPDAPPDIP